METYKLETLSNMLKSLQEDLQEGLKKQTLEGAISEWTFSLVQKKPNVGRRHWAFV